MSECDVLNLDKNVNNIADPVVWMTARNGHKLKKSSRISDRSLSHDSTPDSDDDGYKLVVEDDDDDDDSDDFMEQRAFFGKDNQPTANTPTTTTKASASSTGLSKLSLSYSRDFLLDCAVLPYSKAIPKDLPKIILEVPTILKKVSIQFIHCLKPMGRLL